MLNGLWNAAFVLKGQTTSQISREAITEEVEAIEAVEGVWTLKAQDKQWLAREANLIWGRIKGMQKQLDTQVGELRQSESELSWQGMDPTSSKEYIIQFF